MYVQGKVICGSDRACTCMYVHVYMCMYMRNHFNGGHVTDFIE